MLRRMVGLPPLRASYARKERQALCETARSVGPSAATLCEGWDVKDLICHLLVRESSVVGAAGIAIPRLSRLTDKEMARLRRQPFERLVERLRSHKLTLYALPPVDATFNTLEFFVHHEDIRRAQVGWRRRTLPEDAVDTLWGSLRTQGPALVRSAGVPVVVRRIDTEETTTLMPGRDPVVLSGPVTEVILYLFGRDEVREVRMDGPEEKVAKLRRADRGTF
jgi:uncharacterized protein (TIGR03085 family)